MPETPLRVLIVDDEPPARSRLRRLLGEIGGVEIVGEAGSADEARARVAAARPDLLLLDIQMPGEDGFALLRSLAARPAVVFVTAFDHYAVRAFEENAVDYLLKPFRRERLAEALARARQELAHPAELAARLGALLAGLEHGAGTPHLERFTVRVGLRQLILRADEVLWFGAEDKLVFAATAAGRHYVNLTLDQLERRLDPRRFARVHRGAIVNLDHAAGAGPRLRPAPRRASAARMRPGSGGTAPTASGTFWQPGCKTGSRTPASLRYPPATGVMVWHGVTLVRSPWSTAAQRLPTCVTVRTPGCPGRCILP